MKNLWIVIVVLLVALVFSVRGCQKNKEISDTYMNINSALNDTIQKTRNKLGQEVAKIEVIETASPEMMTELKSKDLKITALQELIKQNLKDLNSATILETNTKVTSTTPTIITKYVTNNDTIYPTYYTKVDKGGWIYGDVTASNDSIITNLQVKNDYDIIVKKEKGKTYAIVTNKNPYTETESLRTFNVKVPKPSPFGLGATVGYGMTSEGEFKPFLGIGLTYTPIRF